MPEVSIFKFGWAASSNWSLFILQPISPLKQLDKMSFESPHTVIFSNPNGNDLHLNAYDCTITLADDAILTRPRSLREKTKTPWKPFINTRHWISPFFLLHPVVAAVNVVGGCSEIECLQKHLNVKAIHFLLLDPFSLVGTIHTMGWLSAIKCVLFYSYPGLDTEERRQMSLVT